MSRSVRPAWVFAGDAPGQWWVVHSQAPRFAARLLSAEEFASEPRYAAWVPHGINLPLPVHFNLGADVLVITDFIDPVRIEGQTSPQSVILTDAMIEALHACQQAIDDIALAQPDFAPLAERSEQFLVGWQLQAAGQRHWLAEHASGARVELRFDEHGDCEASLQQLPPPGRRGGWSEALLRERLERVAGERGLCIDAGWSRLQALDGSTLGDDVLAVLLRQDRRALSWVACEQVDAGGQGIAYVGLRVSGPVARVFPTRVEIDARSPLHLGGRPLDEGDAEAILGLRAGYGLANALSLVAARHFGWFEEPIDDSGDRQRGAALPRLPCEVELVNGGELYAALVFDPANARGLYRLVIAPHAPVPTATSDPATLMPFEGLVCRREQFHLPAYAHD